MTTEDTVYLLAIYLVVVGQVLIVVNMTRDQPYGLSKSIALGIVWPLLLLRYIGILWPVLLGRVARDMLRLTAGER